MSYDEYFYNVWDVMPESIISEEYYEKNQEMLSALTFDLYQFNSNGGNIPPSLACNIIQITFSNMLIFGLR